MLTPQGHHKFFKITTLWLFFNDDIKIKNTDAAIENVFC